MKSRKIFLLPLISLDFKFLKLIITIVNSSTAILYHTELLMLPLRKTMDCMEYLHESVQSVVQAAEVKKVWAWAHHNNEYDYEMKYGMHLINLYKLVTR